MRNILIGWITLLLLVTSSHAAKQKQTLESLGNTILESLQEFYPVRATEMGIHSYDHRFTDYSANSVKNMKKKLTEFEKELYKYKNISLSTPQRTNYYLLKSNVDIALLDLDRIRWHVKSPQVYSDEVVNGFYLLMLSQHAPLSEKLYPILGRMKAVPEFLMTARKNLKNPPPVYIKVAVESLETGIAFYQQVAGELMNQFPDRADEILKVSTAAREAMNDFIMYLNGLTPGPENSIAIGKANYDYKLTNEYFLEYDADSLRHKGEAVFQIADSAYKAYEKYVEPTR